MSCDCLVVGAGPAGSAAAVEMARAGLRVVLVDRGEFPRFRIGESFLPRTREALQRLGLLERCLALPHARKIGVEMSLGDGRHGPKYFYFRDVYGNGEKEAFNMERMHLDETLMLAAREAGAEVRTSCAVRSITRLSDDGVEVNTDAGPISARWMIDASGQATVLGRQLEQRRFHSFLRNVAYFDHYEGVVRPSGRGQNCFGLVVADEGWFWIIPLSDRKTSIGFVARESLHTQMDVPADERLWWAIERTPLMAERMANAVGPRKNRVIADFTFRCDPFAGPGYFKIGDAAAFLDPVWSTGLTVGLLGAEQTAQSVIRICQGARPTPERARYQAWATRITDRAFRLVEDFYDPAMRDLLFSAHPPKFLERTFMSLLAGELDRISPLLQAQWGLLRALAAVQRRVAITSRIRPFRILQQSPAEVATA